MQFSVIATLTLVGAVSGPVSETSTARPLPGNKPCAYPAPARKQSVAGGVRFVARVTPEGATDSVVIKTVPLLDLGFEEAVRGCVAQWRFDPAPGGTGLRSYEGSVRFTLAPAEEVAVRELLERLSVAWNAGDTSALEHLEAVSGELPRLPPQGEHFLWKRVRATDGADKCRMELEPGLGYLRFLGRELADVRQSFGCLPAAGAGGARPRAGVLELTVAKGPRGWRFVRIPDAERPWLGVVRVGGSIPKPRKRKDVRPNYPTVARQAGVQGVVILECLISPEGKVTDIRVLRALPLLDEAAIEAVRQWEYAPTLLEGQPVPVVLTVTLPFKLQ